MTTYDYVIVGAGAAGSVLAYRLSADPAVSVLLIEHGGHDRDPLLHVPKGFYFTLRGDRYTYSYPTRPIGPGGQVEYWTRGKVLGGSTAVNGMMYMRGAAADWDSLARRGNAGWDWATALDAYRRMEDHSLGASDTRGSGGPLAVTIAERDDELVAAVLAAAQIQGWERVADVNASDGERVGFTPATIRRGRRMSAYRAFVHPVRRRPNLTVLTRTRVGALLFDGSRVVGVAARSGGHAEEFRARREVVVSAGAVESTLLLERSGIGRPEVLRRAGVAVRLESPNVGERVIEQRAVSMQVRLDDPIGPARQLSTLPRQAWQSLRYLVTRRGPIATGGYDLIAQFRSSPQLDRPDVQGIWVPMALDTASPSPKPARHPGALFVGYAIRPTTTGSIHLSGPRPEDPPIIDARFLAGDGDRDATVAALDTARRVAATPPFADFVREEEFPGPAVTTRDEALRYALDTGGGIYHAVGANAMGPDDDDVVDPQLRVRGVSGLRIADASVLPVQVSGNSAAPTMAVGWIAGDLILRDS